MIEAGRAYVSANKLFVNGIKDLSQQCKKEEMISVSRTDIAFKTDLSMFTEEYLRGLTSQQMVALQWTFLWFPIWRITAEQYKHYCPDTESSSCLKHDRCDHMQTGDVAADSLHGWRQRDLKAVLWFHYTSCRQWCHPSSFGVKKRKCSSYFTPCTGPDDGRYGSTIISQYFQVIKSVFAIWQNTMQIFLFFYFTKAVELSTWDVCFPAWGGATNCLCFPLFF